MPALVGRVTGIRFLMSANTGAAAAPVPRGFTPVFRREPRALRGHLARVPSEAHGCLALLSVRSFALREGRLTGLATLRLPHRYYGLC